MPKRKATNQNPAQNSSAPPPTAIAPSSPPPTTISSSSPLSSLPPANHQINHTNSSNDEDFALYPEIDEVLSSGRLPRPPQFEGPPQTIPNMQPPRRLLLGPSERRERSLFEEALTSIESSARPSSLGVNVIAQERQSSSSPSSPEAIMRLSALEEATIASWRQLDWRPVTDTTGAQTPVRPTLRRGSVRDTSILTDNLTEALPFMRDTASREEDDIMSYDIVWPAYHESNSFEVMSQGPAATREEDILWPLPRPVPLVRSHAVDLRSMAVFNNNNNNNNSSRDSAPRASSSDMSEWVLPTTTPQLSMADAA